MNTKMENFSKKINSYHEDATVISGRKKRARFAGYDLPKAPTQMNPIDFAYFKPRTHTHTHTHCHICYANSDAAAERELCGESELMLMRSCSCSLTKMQLIHEWRRLRLPHFTPLPQWQRSAAARAHFHALYEIIESKRVSKRERERGGGW